jgi:hypothetical protein
MVSEGETSVHNVEKNIVQVHKLSDIIKKS